MHLNHPLHPLPLLLFTSHATSQSFTLTLPRPHRSIHTNGAHLLTSDYPSSSSSPPPARFQAVYNLSTRNITSSTTPRTDDLLYLIAAKQTKYEYVLAVHLGFDLIPENPYEHAEQWEIDA